VPEQVEKCPECGHSARSLRGFCQNVKVYHVIIWPKPDTPISGTQVSLLKMEMDFAIGFHARTNAETVVAGTLRDLQLTEFMEVISIKEVDLDLESLYPTGD
jgi:hypothetical protein